MTALAPASLARRVRTPQWEFFWLLVRRDLKVRYAGSTLGGLWNLIHPVVMILVYIVIFSSLIPGRLGAGSDPRLYIVHLCSGMLVWLVFADVLSRGVSTLVDNANLLRKVSFPPMILFASILFNGLIVHGAGLVALWLVLLLTGGAPPPGGLGALAIMALAGAAAAGLAMVLSALHAFFRDTAQLVAIALQVGFWLNPIVYPKSLLTGSPLGKGALLLEANPLIHFVASAQALFGDSTAEPSRFAPAVIVLFPALSLVVGVLAFRRLLPEVRDGL